VLVHSNCDASGPVPWNNAANVYMSLHRFQDAEAAVQKSINISTNGMNLVTLGNILIKLKR
jgi:hypothetical protein